MCTWSGQSLAIRDVDASFDTACTNTVCYSYTGPVTFNSHSVQFNSALCY